jgi:membrane associated rhomboid family serine protease
MRPAFGFGASVTSGVQMLLILNGLAFVVFNVILSRSRLPALEWLALSSDGVLHGRVWQLGTYLFLHGDFMHLLFNMFYLYMFGGALEQTWGRRRFLEYYFITGVGAGLVWTLVRWGNPVPTLGASGSVYAILLAFGILFAETTMLLFFIIPMKAKYLVGGLILLEAVYLATNAADGVAHLIHLAGAGIGYLLLRRGSGLPSVSSRYRRWRTKRRLQVIDYRELLKFDDDQRGGRGSR